MSLLSQCNIRQAQISDKDPILNYLHYSYCSILIAFKVDIK